MREVRRVHENKGYKPFAINTKRNVELLPFVMEAKEYYQKDYISWSSGQKKKAMGSLKFFAGLEKWYNNCSINEIAYSLNMSPTRVQQALKQTEQRVITYLKLKELNK